MTNFLNIYGGFAHSRRATLNVEVATFNTNVMALQAGTELYEGSSEIQYYEVMTADADGAVKTKLTATGTAGAELLFVYKVNAQSGEYEKTFTQVSTTPAEGEFSYTSGTKTITFNETDKPVAGDMFAVAYTFKSADNAQVVTITGDGVPATVLATCYGLAKDTCTGELFPCQIDGLAQVDGNWNFDLSADGDPAVQAFNLEYVRGCGSKKLYDFKVYTEEEE